MKERRACTRPLIVALTGSLMVMAAAQPAAFASHSSVSAVTGSAFGYVARVSLFGGPTQTRPCTDNSDPSTCGPAPAVTLPASGSATPITDSRPSGLAQFGPATLFSSGPLTVTTQGTTGPSGSTTTTADIERVNTSGHEVFTADNVSSTCTASGSGISASTTITNGVLNLGSGRMQTVPTNPAPDTTYEGTVDGVGDRFRYVFNEQILNPDGSLTVNAGHQYLEGPTAVGDLIIGQVVCGVTTQSGGNHAPVAGDDAYSTDFNTTLDVAAPGVLANDSDPDGDTLTAGMPTNPANGTLVLNPDGSFRYTPNSGFSGTDSFTYMAHDPFEAMSARANVTITVGSRPASADVGVTITDEHDPVAPGANATYAVTVNNHGPGTATAVRVASSVTNGKLVSVTASKGTCTISKGKTKIATCDLGSLTDGDSATITLTVQAPRKVGSMSVTSTVASDTSDPNTTNNSATESTTVAR